ncbi:MAG: hypothetical protein M3123_04845, partial [Actinomycetota bacterium]|nr:hypothetical protein [Actinomycetota bacterium]
MAPDRFEEQLRSYLLESSEEARAVRVGEKEVSEHAAIVARYADLFTREQRAVLSEAEERAAGDERERLVRLREACTSGIVSLELAELYDELQNAILAERVEFGGESLPLRSAQAKVAVLADYGDREELGRRAADASALFNDRRLDLLRRGEALEADLSGERDPVRRSADLKGIDLHELARALSAAVERQTAAFGDLRERALDRILGDGRDAEPASYHVAFVRRLSPLADVYTKDRSVPVSLETLARLGFDLAANENVRLDLDDR